MMRQKASGGVVRWGGVLGRRGVGGSPGVHTKKNWRQGRLKPHVLC